MAPKTNANPQLIKATNMVLNVTIAAAFAVVLMGLIRDETNASKKLLKAKVCPKTSMSII